MKKFITLLTSLFFISSMPFPLIAVEKNFRLKSVNASGDTVSIGLSGIPKYTTFGLTNPERLVIDFPDTQFMLKDNIAVENNPYFKRIRGSQFKKRPNAVTRIVIELQNPETAYKISEGDQNNILVTFSSQSNEKEASLVPIQQNTVQSPAGNTGIAVSSDSYKNAYTEKIKPSQEAPTRISSEQFEIEGVKIEKDSVSISLTGMPQYNIFSLSKPERLVIDFPNTGYYLKDNFSIGDNPFITKVKGAQFKRTDPKVARVVMELKSDDLVYETSETGGNTLIIKFSSASNNSSTVPLKSENPEIASGMSATRNKADIPSDTRPSLLKNNKLVLSNKPVSFDFEAADIKDVLRVLSIKSGVNIIAGEDVTGTITLRLDNVSFDKAFYTILSLKGLVAVESGPNIIRVISPQQIASEREKAVPFTKVYPLNYSKAADLKKSLDLQRVSEGRRGGIAVDDRTNSLIVTDTPEGLESVERIISELDKKPPQIIIEAKIVELDLNKSTDIGIKWAYAGTAGDKNITIGASQAHVVGDSDLVPGPNATIGNTITSPGQTQTTGVNTGLATGTGVSFPATAPANGAMSSMAFGIVANGNMLNGILSALQQKGSSKVLSSPKVTTINNKEAKILIGQKIPYTTTTVAIQGTVQQTNFLDVGIKLTVTPTINVDQKITLDVHPEVSLYIRTDPAGPVIGTREAQTTVLINDGETVVIGGLITENDMKQATQVPLLGDIPVLGTFFKDNQTSKTRTELLVFITPQIVK